MYRRIKESTAHEHRGHSTGQPSPDPSLLGSRPVPLLQPAYTSSPTKDNNMANETFKKQPAYRGTPRSSQFSQYGSSRLRDMSQDNPHHRNSVSVASNQATVVMDLDQDAESTGYQLRSHTRRNTNNDRRSTLEGVSSVANIVPKPKQLVKRKAMSLGGDGLRENVGENSSFDKQHKKRRASPSFSVLIPTRPRNASHANSESVIRPAVTEPFSFHEEKWLFFNVNGLYPGQGFNTIDWETISAQFNARFKVGRNSDSLGQKWREMMRRRVTMHFYEHGEDLKWIDPRPYLNSITTHSPFQKAATRDLIPVPYIQSAEPQDSNALSTSSRDHSKSKKRFTDEETKWLVRWIHFNKSRQIMNNLNWVKCDQAFTREFNYSRGPEALKWRYFFETNRAGLPCPSETSSQSQSEASSTSPDQGGNLYPSSPPHSASLPRSANPPRPASPSRAHSVASSIPVTPLASGTKSFTWTPAQEEWLLTTCLHGFTKRKLAIDWKKVAVGFRMTYGTIRPAAAFKKKWNQLKGLAGTSEGNAQGENSHGQDNHRHYAHGEN
ncbi:hypothetical protein RUND412_006073 [Rhizina undulata]